MCSSTGVDWLCITSQWSFAAEDLTLTWDKPMASIFPHLCFSHTHTHTHGHSGVGVSLAEASRSDRITWRSGHWHCGSALELGSVTCWRSPVLWARGWRGVCVGGPAGQQPHLTCCRVGGQQLGPSLRSGAGTPASPSTSPSLINLFYPHTLPFTPSSLQSLCLILLCWF